MLLPNVENAVLRQEKITEYLLSQTHPVGRHKAEFFTRHGFSLETWECLADALLSHANTHEVAKVEVTRFGERYVVEGAIESPDGRNPEVRSVWFVESHEECPSFVTAYPLKRNDK